MRKISVIFLAFLLSGCAVKQRNPDDPLEPINRGIYHVNKVLDKTVMEPAAVTYSTVVPTPFRIVIGNFFFNLGEIPTIANDLFQGKVKDATKDSARFIINSSLGLFGLFDVATHLGLQKHKEDFGQTLAVAGYKKSAYVMLPILGPSTIRDSIGRVVDSFANPSSYLSPSSARTKMFVASGLDQRTNLLSYQKVVENSDDPYTFIRSSFLQYRAHQVRDGSAPAREEDELLGEPPD